MSFPSVKDYQTTIMHFLIRERKKLQLQVSEDINENNSLSDQLKLLARLTVQIKNLDIIQVTTTDGTTVIINKNDIIPSNIHS